MLASHTFRLPLLLLLLLPLSSLEGRSHVRRKEPRGEHLASWIDLLFSRKGLLLLLLDDGEVAVRSHLSRPTEAS